MFTILWNQCFFLSFWCWDWGTWKAWVSKLKVTSVWEKYSTLFFPLETISFFSHYIETGIEINYVLNQKSPFSFHNRYAVSCDVLLSNLSNILSSHFSFWNIWMLMKLYACLSSSENTSIEQASTMCSNFFWCKWSAGHIYFSTDALFFEHFYIAGKG